MKIKFADVYALNEIFWRMKGITKNLKTLLDIKTLEKTLSGLVWPINKKRIDIATEYFETNEEGNTKMDDDLVPVAKEGKDRDEGIAKVDAVLQEELDIWAVWLKIYVDSENLDFNANTIQALARILKENLVVTDKVTKEVIDVSILH